MQAEEAQLISKLRDSQSDEVQKAVQTKRQHTVWLQLLQTRLKLQPAMKCAAQWPAAEQVCLPCSLCPFLAEVRIDPPRTIRQAGNQAIKPATHTTRTSKVEQWWGGAVVE